MRTLVPLVFALTIVVLPVTAFAQATIAGTVRDTSGAVLPGVTVEAASPALIEKVRTAVTDSTGQYQIVNLRPGPYVVTFTLTGFTTVRREGIELTAADVATINGELRVGSLEETITVTGEAPIVDVQSSVAQQHDELGHAGRGAGDPRLQRAGVPGPVGHWRQQSGGLEPDDAHLLQPRRPRQRRPRDGGWAERRRGAERRRRVAYVPDTTNSQEMTLNLSGGLGEAETGGAVVNIIPKTGGNVFTGTGFLSTPATGRRATTSMIACKASASGSARVGQELGHSFPVGGPIQTDRAWFYGTFAKLRPAGHDRRHVRQQERWRPNQVDLPERPERKASNAVARTIYARSRDRAATPRNKFGLYFDNQEWCDGSSMRREGEGCRLASDDWVASGQATLRSGSVERFEWAAERRGLPRQLHPHGQATWTSPYTDRMLFEARHLVVHQFLGLPRAAGRDPESRSGHRAARPRRHARRADLPRAAASRTANWQNANVWRASASYVTGANAVKIRLPGRLARLQPLQSGRREPTRPTGSTTACRTSLTMFIRHWNTADTDPVRRALCAGPVDARAPDAPGRGALRPCRQLGIPEVGNGSGSPQPFYPGADVFPAPTASPASTTSPTAGEPPGTCSATARRRSS